MAEEQGDKKPMFTSVEEAQQRYQALQRENQKWRDRYSEAVKAQLSSDEALAETRELRDLVDTLVEGGRLGDAEDEGEQFKTFKEGKAKRRTAGSARREIMGELTEHDLDWSDPSLTETRALFDSGDYAKAVETVKRVVGGKPADDVVAAAVAAELQRLGVKTVAKDGSATPSAFPTDPTVLRERLRDPEWRKTHMEEVKAGIRAGRIK
mgnify:CR=1 FL=1